MAERLDVPGMAVAFSRALHAAGVPTGPHASERFARVLGLAAPRDRDTLYWAARAAFVTAREQVAAFDRVFGAVFDGHVDPSDSRGDPHSPPIPAAEPNPRPPRSGGRPKGAAPPGERPGTAPAASADDHAGERPVVLAAASDQERLGRKSFAALEAHELREVRRMMRRLALAPPERRTRRARRHRRGERLDLRATIRRSLRTGGDPTEHARRRRRRRRRRLVMVCDVSGSMEPYARAYLHLLESAVGGASAEAFVFATRLTRLTRALRGRSAQLAVDRALAAAPDWSGGTRIGEALKSFNDLYGRRGLARGAVVVVLSDGWERGDPELVSREMERLSRLAHRIVWVNPRSAARGFAPLAGGMAAALPHCDAFVSGHSVDALDAVVEAIGAGPRTATT